MEKKSRGEIAGNTTKVWIAVLITLVLIQLAVIAVLIYLATRIGDLSSDVDNLESASESEQEAQTGTQPPPNAALIFNDEFNYFNLTTWKHEITLAGVSDL